MLNKVNQNSSFCKTNALFFSATSAFTPHSLKIRCLKPSALLNPSDRCKSIIEDNSGDLRRFIVRIVSPISMWLRDCALSSAPLSIASMRMSLLKLASMQIWFMPLALYPNRSKSVANRSVCLSGNVMWYAKLGQSPCGTLSGITVKPPRRYFFIGSNSFTPSKPLATSTLEYTVKPCCWYCLM